MILHMALGVRLRVPSGISTPRHPICFIVCTISKERLWIPEASHSRQVGKAYTWEGFGTVSSGMSFLTTGDNQCESFLVDTGCR
mmetsp:Transcript_14375/g.33196  ORF Transcript_14375/g.33196 Transcript_14375/m.33196 type:complete len:84 (+) Transcript_14375:221-472(+)